MTALLALALALLLCGCGQSGEEAAFYIYYPAAQDSAADFALGREQWTEASPTVEAAVERLLQPPAGEELRSVFPKGVRLRDWRLEAGVLTLNFSEDYSALTGVELTLANYCAALTCAELPGVERVSILVEGQPLPEGSSGPFSPEDLLRSGEPGEENTNLHLDEGKESG